MENREDRTQGKRNLNRKMKALQKVLALPLILGYVPKHCCTSC
ncbi:hypothetical protein LptCag_0589 [Leptospirillum ferriphilum]|uniref:Uncharacterized protein n=1 Tax=Leptospirillum ferriphilum TaxID=178606 RepID=A0A094W8W2_9BACT|nr:hypothetical protein LptCag_0589 [Leptospirillum ferriphilum]